MKMRDFMRILEASDQTVQEGNVDGVWYHGTPYMFDEFNVHAGEFDANHETPAIFLTNDPDLAETYASRQRPPIADSLRWGVLKKNYIDPLADMIATSTADVASYLSRSAEDILNGRIDVNKVLEYLPDVAPQVRRLIGKFNAHTKATHTTQGANIRPVSVTGHYMIVSSIDNFHAGLYDFYMREAKTAGLSGVLFKDVVDSPSGGGPPADILAVFDGKAIRPRFAKLATTKV